MNNAEFILNKLKEALNVNTDVELADFLNVKPNTLSTWKKRNSVGHDLIIRVCQGLNLDLNNIFDVTLTKEARARLKGNTPIVAVNRDYIVTEVGNYSSHWSPEGYSKYNDRYKLYRDNQITREEIYGIEQALEHAEEIRQHEYEGKRHNLNKVLEIKEITTTTARHEIVFD